MMAYRVGGKTLSTKKSSGKNLELIESYRRVFKRIIAPKNIPTTAKIAPKFQQHLQIQFPQLQLEENCIKTKSMSSHSRGNR